METSHYLRLLFTGEENGSQEVASLGTCRLVEPEYVSGIAYRFRRSPDMYPQSGGAAVQDNANLPCFTLIPDQLRLDLKSRKITLKEYAVLIYLLQEADRETGIVTTNSREVAESVGLERTTIRDIFTALRRKGKIRGATLGDRRGLNGTSTELQQRRGSTKPYPIVVSCALPVPRTNSGSTEPQRKLNGNPLDDNSTASQVLPLNALQTVTNTTAGQTSTKPGMAFAPKKALKKGKNKTPLFPSYPEFIHKEQGTYQPKGRGGEGGKYLTRAKSKEEIQKDTDLLMGFSVIPEVRQYLATNYDTECIHRHIKQIKKDYNSGQRWRDPAAILVSRIQKNRPTPDFPAEEIAYGNENNCG